jgi:hypothetical protein
MNNMEFVDDLRRTHSDQVGGLMDLLEALQLAVSELGGRHSGHWDGSGRYGAGCEVCIEEWNLKGRLDEVIEDEKIRRAREQAESDPS